MIYKGVVKDNNSPKKDGKLRVHIEGIHPKLDNTSNDFESCSVEHLPWLEVISKGLNKGTGTSEVMDVDSWVYVYVPDDSADIDRMMVIGSVGNAEIDFHDISKGLGQNQENINISKGSVNVNIEGSKDGDSKYPDCTVIHTKAGHLIVIDNTTDNERIKVQSSQNSYIELDKNGITQNSSKNTLYYTKEELNEYVGGAVNKIFEETFKTFFGGAVNIEIDNTTDITAKNIKIKVNGSLEVETTADLKTTSTGNAIFNASKIFLN